MKIKKVERTSIQKVFARYRTLVAPIAIACALSVVASQPTDACGPFSKIAIFVNSNHPDFPLKRYAAGELGIINPGYARSYLVVAYRYLAGIKNSPEQQREFVALWERRLETLDADVQDAISEWQAERKKVLRTPAKAVDAYDTNVYSGYLTYNVDAFKTATLSLKSKIEKYGPDDERVKSWLAVQDRIFGITSSNGDTSQSATKGNSESQPDASYQQACDDFYAKRYDDAAKKFQAIGADKSSPWQEWGDYLAARCYCRKATTGDVVTPEDLKRAKELVDKVLQSKNAKMQAPAKRLMSFIEYRLDPNERAKQVVAALASDGTEADLTEALGDYTLILDKVLEKHPADTQKTSSLPLGPDHSLPDYAAISLLALLGAHRIWRRIRTDKSKQFPSSLLAVAIGISAMSVTLVACAQTNSTAKSETKAPPEVVAQAADAPATTLPSPGDVVFDDDMTKWILNFQDKNNEALNEALEKWSKSKSVPWLVSVISKIGANHARRAEVIAEASKIPPDSPAYLTVQYHLIRLSSEENQPKEALSRLNTLLGQVAPKLPPCARNMFFEMGVSCAGSLADFVKFAAPSPSVITWDYDSNELPDSITDAEPGAVKLKEDEKYLTYPGCLTSPSAEIINELAPLPTYVALATNSALPAAVRLDIAQAAWTRSVMLKNEKMAMTLSPVLGKLRPQLSKALASYDAAATGRDKEFAGLLTILRNPRMRPFVTPGLERETAFDKIDSFRNNWWDSSMPEAPQNMYVDSDDDKKKKAPTASFLTAPEMAQGKKEAATIIAQGTAPNNLAQRVLALSKTNPKEPRLAEMLHLVVTTTRYGNTDDKTTALSKQAFQALHKNFPGNEWTKKTKFWF